MQNGTPLYVVQELGGWSSVQMVQRYAHLQAELKRVTEECDILKKAAAYFAKG